MKHQLRGNAKTSVTVFSLALFILFGFRKEVVFKYNPAVSPLIHNDSASTVNAEAQWWFNRAKNQNTGQLDIADMLHMQELSQQTFAANASARNSNPSTASAQWTELGPDNVGGRTRAILFDNQDATHQHMFAGGVSGGLWESHNAGSSWQKCAGFFSVPGVTITVVTIAQASNGDLYVGTGEGNFYFLFGTGVGGFLGNGIYKSTDDGLSWNILSATQPTTQNNNAAAWVCVNKIACDPIDSNLIYAGTNKGFKESTDGGTTWFTPAGGMSTTAVSTDVEVASNGNVIAVVSAKPWLSTDHGVTFTNVGTVANGFTNSSLGRTSIAIAPTDPNYVYAFCADNAGSLYGMYVSLDGGNTWAQACGAGNQLFDPFSNGGSGQGTFDNVVTVDPANKNRAIFGGVQLWEWNLVTTNPVAGQWTQIASEYESIFNPTYCAEDKHAIVFQPGNPTVFFIGTDRGIFRTTNNGQTYISMNSGYSVTQCFSVAYDHHSINKNIAMISCQDLGTQIIDGTGNTNMSARKIFGEVGSNCEVSFLNPNAIYGSSNYGGLFRSHDFGNTIYSFYSSSITSLLGYDFPGFANFVTPISLWESENDSLSGDSILIINSTFHQNLATTNGDSIHYNGTLTFSNPVANPSGTIILDSVMFIAGPDTLFSDAAGNLSGDGTGTISTNGTYSLYFNTTPATNLILKAQFNLQYGAGTIFTVNSNVAGRTINYTSVAIDNPGDTIKVQDVFQSHLAVGFTGNNGIWITRQAINFSVNPFWIKIGGANSLPDAYSGTATCIRWTPDGNNLFVGTDNGNVYRFGNLGVITDSTNGDVDNGQFAANPNCIVTCHLIGNFPNRYVTALDVNPNNPNQVVVSLGNYGNSQYVFLSNNATTATNTVGTFTNKTGNLVSLGEVPAYSISFDKYVAGRVLVGTEHGIVETMNINAITPVYNLAMNGLDNVSVNMIRQQRWEPWQVSNAGCFYIATHGRGIWRDDSSWQQPTGINSPSNPSTGNSSSSANHDLKIFPNPVVDDAHVNFTLTTSGNVALQIFDLSGKVVLSHNYVDLIKGNNSVAFEVSGLAKGTYLIVVGQNEKQIGTGRFVKME